jgi:DNA replication protein DnaC
VDDFALQALDALDTADIYELIVERHRTAATVVTSNREPVDWYGLFPNPVVAEGALDRLVNRAHHLLMEGNSYRPNKRPGKGRPHST